MIKSIRNLGGKSPNRYRRVMLQSRLGRVWLKQCENSSRLGAVYSKNRFQSQFLYINHAHFASTPDDQRVIDQIQKFYRHLYTNYLSLRANKWSDYITGFFNTLCFMRTWFTQDALIIVTSKWFAEQLKERCIVFLISRQWIQKKRFLHSQSI